MEKEAPQYQDIPLHPVESSQIAAIGHDPETNMLAIEFAPGKTQKRGSIYHYRNFTATDYDAFRTAESLGSHFGQHIKPQTEKYPFVKVRNAEPIAA